MCGCDGLKEIIEGMSLSKTSTSCQVSLEGLPEDVMARNCSPRLKSLITFDDFSLSLVVFI